MKQFNLLTSAFVTILLAHRLKFASPYPLFSDYDSPDDTGRIKSEVFVPVQKMPTILTIVTLEETEDGQQKRMVNDPSKMEVKINEYRVLMYTMTNDAKCVEIIYEEQGLKMNNRTIWKHNPKEDGDNYPRKIFLNREYRYITLVMRKAWVYNYEFDVTRYRFSLLSKRKLESRAGRSERAARRARSASRRPQKDDEEERAEDKAREASAAGYGKEESPRKPKKDAEVQTEKTTKDAETQTERPSVDAEIQVDMDEVEEAEKAKEEAIEKGAEGQKDEEKKKRKKRPSGGKEAKGEEAKKKEEAKEKGSAGISKVAMVLICVLVPIVFVILLGIVGLIWSKTRSENSGH